MAHGVPAIEGAHRTGGGVGLGKGISKAEKAMMLPLAWLGILLYERISGSIPARRAEASKDTRTGAPVISGRFPS